MEGGDDGFTQAKTGGRAMKQKKEQKETVLPSAQEQKGKKKKQTTFMYGETKKEEGEEEKKVEQEQQRKQSDEHEDEEENKGKKSKNQKRAKKGNQKGKDKEEEKVEVEAKEEAKVESKPKKEDGMPLEVVYCKNCSLPPEYCMHDKKDSSECKKWLQETHPLLFQKIYGEEQKTEGEKKEGEEQKQQQKKKKKVGIAVGEQPGEIKVYKTKRGAKKVITFVVGLQTYGVNLKDVAKQMSKKFACSATVTDDEKYGESIQMQGDIQVRFQEFVDNELGQYKIPKDKISFVEEKKKKQQTQE